VKINKRHLLYIPFVVFLLINLFCRYLAVWDDWPVNLGFVVGGLLCFIPFFYPKTLNYLLLCFAFTFPLYGMNSYFIHSQIFEFLVTALTSFLICMSLKEKQIKKKNILNSLLIFYVLLAAVSLLLLPVGYLIETFLLWDIATFSKEVLNAREESFFYSIASVNRLALFAMFAIQLSRMKKATTYFKTIFFGATVGLFLTSFLGVLDFSNIINLEIYKYGFIRQRMQGTFGNPIWFSEYILITLPFFLCKFSFLKNFT